MDKFLYFNELFSLYGKLLTKNEQNIFSLYYEENLSLQEIADNIGISKSAVGNTVKTVETKLTKYETTLRLLAKTKILEKVVNENIDAETKDEILKILEGRWHHVWIHGR